MACGEGADFDVPFEKRIFSAANAKCRRMIKEIVEREGFDVILLNTSLAAYHIRRALPVKSRPRVVNLVHGYLFSEKKRGLKGSMLLFAERLERKKTDKILVMNNEDLKIAKKWSLSASEPIMTLGMGATCKPEGVPRDEIRKEHGAEDKLVLSFVGELSKRKNQRMLIEALPEIKSTLRNAVLWLIGEGDELEPLKQLAKRLGVDDSVLFLGRSDNPCDFIRASDVYVSAAKIEGMPFNIIEALGTGVPIVASDIKGHRDLLSTGAGILYPDGDKASFVRGVISAKKASDAMKTVASEVYGKYSFDNVFSSTYKAITEAMLGE